MAEQTVQTEQIATPDPALHRVKTEPKGVIRKNLKVWIFLGASAVVVAAAVISNYAQNKSAHSAQSQHEPPQPALQDNTDNNVQDLKNQLAAERQKEAQAALNQSSQTTDSTFTNGTSAQHAVAAGFGQTGQTGQTVPCAPGPQCPQQGVYAQPQISPEEQQAQQLAARERELAYNARFASNLVYTQANAPQAASRPDANPKQVDSETKASSSQPSDPAGTSLIPSRQAAEKKSDSTADSAAKRNAELNIDSAVGQPYAIYEGLTMDMILMNRLDGDAPGPIKVMVSSPVYSHDRQHVLIPDGTIALGEARKIGSSGFGQQRRMAVAFHRMIMPDGYSADLDQFRGLDQIGEEGLKDQVNNHYLEIFGTSIALGVIAGASQIEAGGGTITTSGSQAFTTGTASSVSQSATTVLDRFIQIPPTITIREGHRVKVYFTQDMLLPAYDNHTIPQTF
jgi:type IV secretory pathway VirB10-like protein